MKLGNVGPKISYQQKKTNQTFIIKLMLSFTRANISSAKVFLFFG